MILDQTQPEGGGRAVNKVRVACGEVCGEVGGAW